jgi:formylglycine-generating enzyme required for sulfatase activity
VGGLYHDSYSGAPDDASAWVGGECKYRVLRGGSWFDDPRVRSAVRNGNPAGVHSGSHGFRVGMTLTP